MKAMRQIPEIVLFEQEISGGKRGFFFEIFNCRQFEESIGRRAFDVAVDIRESSPTFGQWVGEYLSADNKRQLWVPEGFAHGFVGLSEMAEFLYKTTDYYAPEHERSILWNDPALAIVWPIDAAPTLSAKDQCGQLLECAEVFA